MTATARRWTREAAAAALAVLAIGIVRRKRMFPHGYGGPSTGKVSPEAEVYECLHCEGTNTCKFYELHKDGWETHKLEDDTYVVICKDCKDSFAERRRMHAALAKGAA